MVCAIHLAKETNQKQLIKHFHTRTRRASYSAFPLDNARSLLCTYGHTRRTSTSLPFRHCDLWSKAPWTLICAECCARAASTAGLRPLASLTSDCLHLFSKNISCKGLTLALPSSTGAAHSAAGLSGARQVAPLPAASARPPCGRQRGDAGLIASAGRSAAATAATCSIAGRYGRSGTGRSAPHCLITILGAPCKCLLCSSYSHWGVALGTPASANRRSGVPGHGKEYSRLNDVPSFVLHGISGARASGRHRKQYPACLHSIVLSRARRRRPRPSRDLHDLR